MKISAFEVRVGNLIEYQEKLWRIYKTNHVKPGKGGAFVQMEMKCIGEGTKLNERFRSEDKVDKVHVEVRQMQYLYTEGDSYIFMDNETFEQLTMSAEDLVDQIPLLLPNTDVQINFHNDSPIGIDLPINVILEVIETDVMLKGQTATSGGKPAVLETGYKLTVPQFISIGDKVKVNTETGQYVERV